MAGSDTDSVPRSPDPPTPEDVLEEMNVCEPYTTSDLIEIFEDDDPSRWTIQRRLETLHERGDIRKKKHGETKVSYWIPAGGEH